MTERRGSNATWPRDPWPSPQEAWPDPPWVMQGRALTAWFSVPWSFATRAMSPDLLPERVASVRIRLRYYDLRFQSLSRPSKTTGAVHEGRFKEATVAFPARVGQIQGEVSLFMWSDSDVYLAWGREVFGWPLLPARIALGGAIWEPDMGIGAQGSARVQGAHGSASIGRAQVRESLEPSSDGPCWITPRRIIQRGGLAPETREILLVRPNVRRSGARFLATGQVKFDFTASHPLRGIEARTPEIEVIDDFEIVVGENVDRASPPGSI